MAAQRMERWGMTDPKQAKIVSELVKTTERATRILNDLLDLTRSSFGTDIPIARVKTDMAKLCETIADELRSINETRLVKVKHEGDPVGNWDAYIARLIVELTVARSQSPRTRRKAQPSLFSFRGP